MWYGTQTALDGRGVDVAGFVRLAIMLAIPQGMLQFYNAQIPGVGLTTPEVISGMGSWIQQAVVADAGTAPPRAPPPPFASRGPMLPSRRCRRVTRAFVRRPAAGRPNRGDCPGDLAVRQSRHVLHDVALGAEHRASPGTRSGSHEGSAGTW